MGASDPQLVFENPRALHGDELAQLRSLQEEVRRERCSRAVVLFGPRGAGSESLLSEWKAELHREREHVFCGDCLPGAAVYAPLAEIVIAYIRAVENMGLMTDEIGELYATVGSHLGIPGQVVVDVHESDSEKNTGQILFFENLGHLFTELSEKLSAIVTIRDLHLSDSATRDAVTYLLQNVVTDPVGSFTPDGLKRSRFVGMFLLTSTEESGVHRSLRRSLGDRDGATFINLRGVTEEAVRRFLMRPEVVKRFVDSSGGLTDNLQDLLETIPEKVEDLFLRRCEDLNDAEFEVLGGLAVFGKPVGPDLLMRMLNNQPDPALLSSLFKQRVVSRRVHRGQLLIDLPTADNRRLVYERMNPGMRADLHGRMAALLEERMHFGEPTDMAELASHYLKSDQPERAIDYAISAAERLHISFAYERAVELLEGVLPSISVRNSRHQVLDRLIDLHGCQSEHRKALFYCGLLKKELAPESRGPIYRRVGEMLLELGDYQRSLRTLANARRLVEAIGDEQNGLDELIRIDTIAAEAHYGLGEYERVVEVCESGLERVVASPSADAQRLVSKLSNTLGKVHLFKEEYSKASHYFLENQRRAEEYSWPDVSARSRFNLGIIALQKKRYKEAEDIFTICLDNDRSTKSPIIRAFCLMNLGVVYHKTHRYDQALDAYLHGLATFKNSGNDLQFAVVAMNLGALYQEIGDHIRAEALIQTSLEVTTSKEMIFYQGWAHYILGAVAIDRDRLDEAERCLNQAFEIMESLGSPSWRDRIRIRQAWLAHARGEVEACEQLLGQIRFDMTSREGKEIEGDARLCLGRLRADGEQSDEADAEYQRAHDLYREIGSRDRLCFADYLLARRAIDTGRNVEARQHLKQAEAFIKECAAQLPATLAKAYNEAPKRRLILELSAELAQSTTSPGSSPRRQLTLPSQSQFSAWRAQYGRIIGNSPRLLQIFRMIDKVADSDSTILVQGDSGTGKELIAQAIHDNSSRRDKPFIKVNCAAFVETLLLSELFGHEKGAFTGALARKKGRFELANHGTIFLDEIGDISANTQVALLRVLQENTLERVGGTDQVAVDVRVVVATNRNIESLVKRGQFRLDLYYRLKSIILDLPPLMERRGDIPELLHHFLRKYQPKDRPQSFSHDAVDFLGRYSWPGNIRELENFTRSMTLFVDESVVELEHVLQFEEFFADGEVIDELPTIENPEYYLADENELTDPDDGPKIVMPTTSLDDVDAELEPIDLPQVTDPHEAIMGWALETGVGLPELRRQLEVEYIKRALTATAGNITKAAGMLDMKRPRLSQIINASAELATLKERLLSA